MKKTIYKIISIGSLIFFIGCSGRQPSFNRNNKNIVFVEGKPYLIPINTKYGTSPIRDQASVKYNNNLGGNCHIGDIAWYSQEIINKSKGLSQAQKLTLMRQGIRYGHMACASPLSNQQYQYVLQQQQINTQIAANNAQIRAYQSAQTDRLIQDTLNRTRADSQRIDAQINGMNTPTYNKAIIGKMPGDNGYWIKYK